MNEPNNEPPSPNAFPIEATMSAILATMFAILVGLHFIQLPTSPQSRPKSTTMATLTAPPKWNLPGWIPLQLPNTDTEPSKYCYELFCWNYTAVWISIFAFIVISQCYDYFTAWGYLIVCGGLALPLVLQPFVYPQAWTPKVNDGDDAKIIVNPDTRRPFWERYATKATVYLMTYSFIGNYWYTHYFYSVLKARYTMPSHRLNDVPIAMFFFVPIMSA